MPHSPADDTVTLTRAQAAIAYDAVDYLSYNNPEHGIDEDDIEATLAVLRRAVAPAPTWAPVASADAPVDPPA